MNTYTVYKHTAPNGKIYIGITSQRVVKRWDNGRGYSKSGHFRNAINKYGWENITHEIIATNISKTDAAALEKKLISEYDSTNPAKGYNMSTGGEYGSTGIKQTPDVIENRVKHYRGIPLKEAHKKKISDAHRGQKFTDEHRENLSAAHKGNKNPHTEEWNAKIGAAQKGAKNHAYGKPSHRRKKILCIETGTVYTSLTAAAKETNTTISNICMVCNGQRERAGGHRWQYVKEGEQ